MAVAAGFGVMALPRSRADIPGVTIWENAPLPKLPDIFCGIYVRGGVDVEEREQIADAIAAALRPEASLYSVPGFRRRVRRPDPAFQACAKPDRCAQPVMRASRIAISQYMTMPSTASTIRPAKISGTWNCAWACSIRLPMP